MSIALALLLTIPTVEWTALPSNVVLAIQCAGDLNSDGTEDLFVASANGYDGILCLDGLTGEVIWRNDQIIGISGNRYFRAIGDINGDSHKDLALVLTASSTVVTLSGATGEIIWQSQQSNSIKWLEHATGSLPGEVAVLLSTDTPYSYEEFYALDGLTGTQIWTTGYVATLNTEIRVTDSDASGNGWSEMGYSVDRGTVMNGYAVVLDGGTGQNLGGQSTCYYGRMDLCDGPYPCLAVSSWGWNPVMVVKSIATGSIVWQSGNEDLYFQNIDFIDNVTGGSTPYNEILGWQGNTLQLIRGDDGFYADTYMFPYTIVDVDCFLDENEEWRLAVLTSNTFHCPIPLFYSPLVEPSVTLPGDSGYDMCLLESDAYETPLIGIALASLSSPGVCVISTSPTVGISPESASLLLPESQLELLSNPCRIGLTLLAEANMDITLTDVTGRVIDMFTIHEGEQVFRPLPAGVYLILNSQSGALLYKSVVL